MYTMRRRHASDLSPAQSLLAELRALTPPCLHQTPLSSPHLSPLSATSSSLPYAWALRELFSAGLRYCEQHTTPRSWQRRRLYALLGPMYLEVVSDLDTSSPPAELLSAAQAWEESSSVMMSEASRSSQPQSVQFTPCERCAPVRARAIEELSDLLGEMIS